MVSVYFLRSLEHWMSVTEVDIIGHPDIHQASHIRRTKGEDGLSESESAHGERKEGDCRD